MEEIAEVYARALFEVATEKNKIDVVREELGQFTDALADSRELQTFFFSPYFSTEEKKDGLHKAVTGADPEIPKYEGRWTRPSTRSSPSRQRGSRRAPCV